MLRMLSNREHEVITAFVVAKRGKMSERQSHTRVKFVAIPEQEIVDYVKTGEPMDKAGSYAAQGIGANSLALLMVLIPMLWLTFGRTLEELRGFL